MKILFVSSGNKSEKAVPVVYNQAESLINQGVDIDFFLIRGKGLLGYLNNLKKLKLEIKNNQIDVIHAHGVSSLLATLTLKKSMVVSLLGSELNESFFIKLTIKVLSKFYWKQIIVKSSDMFNKLGLKNSDKISIIPNGVNLNSMKITSKNEARESVDWKLNDKIVLFLADPNRKSKNFQLAQKAFLNIDNEKIKLVNVYNIPMEQVSRYLFATDVLLLTSRWEGSPNIVKEAMACNCPVVATNVGDVEWLFGDEPGHFLTNFDPADVAEKIKNAIDFVHQNGRTNGRERIIRLGLDSETVAKKIINVYHNVLNTTAINE